MILWGGDNTLNLVNPSNPNVLGYRFVTIGDEASYLFIGNMPYYTGSKTSGDIVSFAKANLNSNTSEPNLQA